MTEKQGPRIDTAKAEEGAAEGLFEFRGVCKAFDERWC